MYNPKQAQETGKIIINQAWPVKSFIKPQQTYDDSYNALIPSS